VELGWGGLGELIRERRKKPTFSRFRIVMGLPLAYARGTDPAAIF
jgi:hypothetical protein